MPQPAQPRSLSRALLIAALCCMAMLLIPSAHAQNDGAVLDAPDAGGLTDDDIRAMGTDAQLESSGEAIERMRSTLSEVAGLLDRTRQEERDVMKLNCINSRLTAIKAFVKLGERANVALQSAANQSKVEDQAHQTKLVLLADTRVQSLRDEVETCSTGELVPYTGPSRTIIEIDDNILQTVPLDSDTEVVPLEPLPEVSPYQ